jgi:membrane protein DedA with SNARE-associated domain
MNGTLQFLIHYGYLLLFGWVFAEQIGVPIPSLPLLLAAGALVGSGRMNPAAALALPVLGALCADVTWYELGRRKGVRVLHLLCRIAIEPDSCVRNTENVFARHGSRSLLVAKFVPGLGTAAAPLAGIFHMKLRRFVLLDGAGAAIWAGTYLALGYIFSNQLDAVASHAARLGAGLLVLLAAALGAWILWKFIRRTRFIRQLRIDRITPQELKKKLDAGEKVVIVDLRGSLDFEAEPHTIPGAAHLDPADIDEVKDVLAEAAEVVLYCT